MLTMVILWVRRCPVNADYLDFFDFKFFLFFFAFLFAKFNILDNIGSNLLYSICIIIFNSSDNCTIAFIKCKFARKRLSLNWAYKMSYHLPRRAFQKMRLRSFIFFDFFRIRNEGNFIGFNNSSSLLNSLFGV